MQFLFVDPGQRSGDVVTLDSEQSHYLLRVLRLQEGESIDLVPRSGDSVWRARIEAGRRGTALGRVASAERLPPLPGPPVHLVLASLKADRLEWALQKTVELGIDSFSVLAARHSVKIPGGSLVNRLTAIAEAACQQSGRWRPPEITGPVSLATAICRTGERGGVSIVLHPGPELPRLRELELGPDGAVSYFVGPEGGFSADEIAELAASGARVAALDGNLLRAETAAVAAGAMILARLGRI